MTAPRSMKTTTQTAPKSIMVMGPAIQAVLASASIDYDNDGAYQAFLTSTIGGTTELRVQDGNVDLTLDLFIPAGLAGDFSSVKVHGAKIEVHKSLDDVPLWVQQALTKAKINSDQTVKLATAIDGGYPIVSLGETGGLIAELLSTVEVTPIVLDGTDEIRNIAEDIIDAVSMIFADLAAKMKIDNIVDQDADGEKIAATG